MRHRVEDDCMGGSTMGLFCVVCWTSLYYELYELRVSVEGATSVHGQEHMRILLGRWMPWREV